jgi:cytochrome P450
MTGGCPHGHDKVAIADATLMEPGILARPTKFYERLRTEDTVHFDPKLNMWLVSRYDDIVAIERDPITFSVEKGYQAQYAKGFVEEFKEILRRDGGGFFPDAIMSDPPYHTLIRKLMEKAFTAHRVKQLEPAIAKIVVDMLGQFASRGRMDGIKEFAAPMTIKVICAQLGLDQFDSDKIQRWSLAVTAQIGRMQNREQMIENAKDVCDLQNYLIARIREREAAPREDMISDLVHARIDDPEKPKLSFEEVVSLVRALLVAGNETTATALGNLLFVLATQPEMLKLLRQSADDDRLLTRFVEELLRIEPPVRGLARMTTKEVELGGKKLPAGAHLLLLFASANDDDKEFACPRDFDLNRGNLGKHLSFGAGVHRCVGLSLARMEIKVAAREIVKRIDNIKLAIKPEDITYLPTIATHSMASLPLTFSRV